MGRSSRYPNRDSHGWAFDATTEIMTREELIERFSIEKINRTGAIFDINKLDWMNGYYIRQLRVEDLTERLVPYLQTSGIPARENRSYLEKIVPQIQERIKKLSEAPELVDFFFADQLEYDGKLLVAKGLTAEASLSALRTARGRIEQLGGWDRAALEDTVRPLADELGLKTGQLFGILRVAVTGRTVAPPLFETMEVLGRERSMLRIAQAEGTLSRMSEAASA